MSELLKELQNYYGDNAVFKEGQEEVRCRNLAFFHRETQNEHTYSVQ